MANHNYPPTPKIPENWTEIEKAAQKSLDALSRSGVSQSIDKVNCSIDSRTIDYYQSMNLAISQALRGIGDTIFQAMQDYWSNMISQLSQISDIAQKLSVSLGSISLPELSEDEKEQLVDSNRLWGQYGWTYIPSMPITLFDSPPGDIESANVTASRYCSDAEIDDLFCRLQNWNLNQQDLQSAVFCYKNEQYKACALLLCGMIDSQLIQLRTDAKRPVGARAVGELKGKYEGNGAKILTEAMFAYNLFAYLETLFASGHGFKSEPNTLNRNFIGHGMNCRAVRKMDCIQLFLALNNLMNFFDLEL